MNQYRKTVTAVLGAIVTILALYGVNIDPELTAAFTTLITAVLVYLVPNES